MASTASPLAQPEQDRVGHGAGKRPRQDGDSPEQRKAAAAGRRRKKKKKKPVDETSAEGVLLADIRALQRRAGTEEGPEDGLALPELGSHIEVDVVELSSTGDGLGLQPGSRQIYVVPFAAAGDTARVKVFRHVDDEGYSLADFVSATKPSALRDDGRIGCRYFGRCGGCQLQMLAYEEQLRFKQGVVAKAFRNFAQLPAALVPPVQATVGSPLQYGYRTKLTPHFDGPPTRLRKQGLPFDALPPVGFMAKGTRSTLDIEDCPIGTPAVRAGMRRERARMTAEFATYRRGATLLLREDTRRYAKADAPAADAVPPDAIRVDCDGHTDVKTAITDNNATSTEYVGDFVFTNPAGAFFQNNNSILPAFTEYVRERVLPPPSDRRKPVRYLIDAYSGSGLFTVALSAQLPGGSVGIDISDKSIDFARANARLNGFSESQCRFIAADAPELFRSVAYDPEETVVVLDPPRKGCDASFLSQLLAFGPRRIVYVSCNVHTQARDVGMLVRGEVAGAADSGSEAKAAGRARYEIESLRGFDFFPQTGHVEGVAILSRVEGKEEVGGGGTEVTEEAIV